MSLIEDIEQRFRERPVSIVRGSPSSKQTLEEFLAIEQRAMERRRAVRNQVDVREDLSRMLADIYAVVAASDRRKAQMTLPAPKALAATVPAFDASDETARVLARAMPSLDGMVFVHADWSSILAVRGAVEFGWADDE